MTELVQVLQRLSQQVGQVPSSAAAAVNDELRCPVRQLPIRGVENVDEGSDVSGTTRPGAVSRRSAAATSSGSMPEEAKGKSVTTSV